MKWILTCCASVFLLGSAVADDLFFNQLEAPRGLNDLQKIESMLQESLEKVRPATVSLAISGGAGSGVIISPDGLVLTAAHVSGGVDRDVTVIMEDGIEYEAISLGLDSTTDCAMVKIQGQSDLPFVEVDKVGLTELGDWVFVVAHPGGYDKDRGSVVRLGRLVVVDENTIQSDCKLIGGDSGGPLFDMTGRLIGINSRVGASLEQSMHAPIEAFVRVWDEMLGNTFVGKGPFAEKPKKGDVLLGVVLEEREEKDGLLLKTVAEKSAAERAGLEDGDILKSFNGEEIKTRDDLLALLKEMNVGDVVPLKYERDGELEEAEVKLKQRL